MRATGDTIYRLAPHKESGERLIRGRSGEQILTVGTDELGENTLRSTLPNS